MRLQAQFDGAVAILAFDRIKDVVENVFEGV
jgi:hypothetical protein